MENLLYDSAVQTAGASFREKLTALILGTEMKGALDDVGSFLEDKEQTYLVTKAQNRLESLCSRLSSMKEDAQREEVFSTKRKENEHIEKMLNVESLSVAVDMTIFVGALQGIEGTADLCSRLKRICVQML